MSSTSRTEDIGGALVKLVDKLAGKGSDLKLRFEDLTLSMGPATATLNGAIVLDVVYSKEVK